MQVVANIVIAIGAIGLFIVGGYLGFSDKTASATAVLGFAFLLVVLLLLAKFKHVKGFGFEAEMWEETQVEAAKLVERLTLLSNAVAQQVALIASKLGMWDSALSLPQMADLMQQIDQLLEAAKTGKTQREEMLAPLYGRIELIYWGAAHRAVITMLNAEIGRLNLRVQSAAGPERDVILALAQTAAKEQEKFGQIDYRKEFLPNRTLQPLISFVSSAQILSDVQPTLLPELRELETDLKHFIANRRIRRKSDFSSLAS
jgi:hypothetical protein